MFWGLSYPKFLAHGWIYRLWKRHFCGQGIHLFDEVLSSFDTDMPKGWSFHHYLHCDACDFMVQIGRATTFEQWRMVRMRHMDDRLGPPGTV